MKKKSKCAQPSADSFELHELYKKHEYKEISEGNAISVCAGCGCWIAGIDRDTNSKSHTKLKLLPRDFGDTGPFVLGNVMKLLNEEQQLSLALHLKGLGYGSKDAKRRVEIEKYLDKETAI